MAIKIPSKSIYKKQNPKIRDNVIDNMSVEQTIVSPSNEYEVSVYNEKFSAGTILTEKNTTNRNIEATGKSYQNNFYGAWIVNAEISKQKVLNKTFDIPKTLKNKYISTILYGKNQDGENEIKYSVYAKLKKGQCTQKVTWDTPDGITIGGTFKPDIDIIEEIVFSNPTEESNDIVAVDFNSNVISSYKGTPNSSLFPEIEITSTLKPIDISNVVKFIEYYDRFSISIDIMASIVISKLGGSGFDELGGGSITLEGSYEEFTPVEIEITFYGNTIGIDLTDGSVTYGNGNKPYSFSGNELMQTTNALNTPINGETNAIKYLYGKTLNAFKNGKEAATIRCSISDYYDEEHNKAIDIEGDRMCFKIGDNVEPCVYGANGQDIPMSRYKDGSPKVFTVVGTNIIYDGAVWQELTLIEKNIDN